MDALKIRNYQDNDFNKLEQLLKDTGLYYESVDKKEIFKKKIEHDSESIIIAEDDDKIIGTVFIIYDPWNPCIYHLGVHPDYRNKGIGNKLMDEAEGRLIARGSEITTLFVDEENQKAIEFYKNRRWKVCNKNLAMEKELNQKTGS